MASTIGLTVIGLLPAVLLMIYIYNKDRIEKEPKGLLVGLFFLGVAAVIPTMIMEALLSVVNNAIFFGQTTVEYEYAVVDGRVYLYEFFNNFFGIALVEEGFKWLFMFLITRKSKSFNCLFDGVVYAAFVSLGFAAAENVMYVFMGGLSTGAMRFFTAVPAHCAFSVVMGAFYGKWFVCRNAGALEKHLYQNRVILTAPRGFGAGKYLLLSLLIPMAIHGFYDFCCHFTAVSWIYWFLLFVLLVVLYVICFRNVGVLSKKDAYITYLCMEKVLERYPFAAEYLCRMPEHALYFMPAVIQASIMSREPHGVKVTANNLYFAHPLPEVGTQPVYPQPVPYAQPPMPQQPVQPPMPQQPVQPPIPQQPVQPPIPQQTQPVPYAQPIQHTQPAADRPHVQRVQNVLPAVGRNPYTGQGNEPTVGSYHPYGGSPTQSPDQCYNPYTTQR